MCDTVCALGDSGAIFAKSSDRPVGEAQVIEAFPARNGGGMLRTQYLELADTGAYAMSLSRPVWLWGAEHGVNEHRVAIGNEKIYTVDDPYEAPPALIGMDLVRLGLERGASAAEALSEMTDLLERHGQGGVADRDAGEPYWSSFLVADPLECFVLETSARTWAAKRVRPGEGGAAISNRITLGGDWTMASSGVPAGSDFDAWRNPEAPTGHADQRLEASRRFLSSTCPALGTAGAGIAGSGIAGSGIGGGGIGGGGTLVSPAEVVAHLRDHGTGPWAAPMGDGSSVVPPPDVAMPDGTGVTVCMHVRGYQATAASMVVSLPRDEAEPVRAWAALGNPCASVFVPFLPSAGVPAILGEEPAWSRFAALARMVEDRPGVLGALRAILGPLEDELWEEAGSLPADPRAWRAFAEVASRRVAETLGRAETACAAR